MSMLKLFVNIPSFLIPAAMLILPFLGCGAKKDLKTGFSWEVTETSNLAVLTIAEGASIKAPEGCSLTMTVDSIEKDILPGKYKGDIVLTVAEDNVVKFSDRLAHYFRQVLYVDKTGVVKEKSVTSAIKGGNVTDTGAHNITITSEGENFNGIYVTEGGTYRVEKVMSFLPLEETDKQDYADSIRKKE